MIEERARVASSVQSAARSLGTSFGASRAQPIAYSQIESQDDARITSGIAEFDRVLGGGIVPGSLVLIGGDPGIGKSTLLLQVADSLSRNTSASFDISEDDAREDVDSSGDYNTRENVTATNDANIVLYVSGEESERQIKMRGERLGIRAENLFLLPETTLENILDIVDRVRPKIIIVDSIQTIFSANIESAPGSVSQVREVAGKFLMLAKKQDIPVFLIGHVTKEGSIAGPKALEHIVDTVLYFEGERHHNHRIVRATKNRFGAANELGVFEMTGAGLVAVANPSEMFLQERPEGAAGSVVMACMEGTRPMLVEVQALVGSSKYGTGRRMAQGYDTNRVALLIAMLEKRVGLNLGGDDVFVNIAGGMEIDEPAADLGVVAAIASSFRNLAVEQQTAVFGEVGLTGEVRGAMQAQSRVREAQALGFKRIICPASNTAGMERLLGIRTVGVRTVDEALEELLQ